MKSSWIFSILYKRCPDGHTYIAVFTRDKEPTAMLFGGPEHPIPSYLAGLLNAGIPKKKENLRVSNFNGGWRYGFVEEGALQPLEWSIPYMTREKAIKASGKEISSYHSAGRAYHKLLKGKYPCQIVKGEKKVRELKEMIT